MTNRLYIVRYRINYDEKLMKNNKIPKDLLRAAIADRFAYFRFEGGIRGEYVDIAGKKIANMYASYKNLSTEIIGISTGDAYPDVNTGKSVFDSICC